MLLLHAAGIFAVAATAWLGQWQLDAWQEHRRDRTAELADAPPRPLREVIGADDPFPADGAGRPVETMGRWRPDATVLVSDRLRDGTRGYWMVTPLATCGSVGAAGSGPEACDHASALPVVLGWTPRTADAPPPPRGRATVVGWLQPGETGDGTTDPDPADDVLPAVRIGELAQRLDEDLYSGYLILDAPAEVRGTLAAVTPGSLPKPSSFTALRNLLYGVQWWVFGLFAVFLWWRWARDEVQRATAPDDDDEDDDENGDEGENGDRDVAVAAQDPAAAVADRTGRDARIASEP